MCRDVHSYACMYVHMYAHVRIWGWQALLLRASLNPHSRARGKLPPTQTNTSARLLVHTHYEHIHVHMYMGVPIAHKYCGY